MEKITNLGPDVILLYTSKENMERLLNQQVILIVFPTPPPPPPPPPPPRASSSPSSSFHLFLPILFDDTSFYKKAAIIHNFSSLMERNWLDQALLPRGPLDFYLILFLLLL